MSRGRERGADSQQVGLVYRNPRIYRLAMRLLDRDQAARWPLIAASIPDGSRVADLCCGDASVADLLVRKGCHYVGFDINRRFVVWAKRRGLDVREWDARIMDIPSCDIICMFSSLYQFIPEEREMLMKMLDRAEHSVVLSEPVRNWASSDSRLLRQLARALTHIEGISFERRHDEGTLAELLAELPPKSFKTTLIGRELLIVIDSEAVRAGRRP